MRRILFNIKIFFVVFLLSAFSGYFLLFWIKKIYTDFRESKEVYFTLPEYSSFYKHNTFEQLSAELAKFKNGWYKTRYTLLDKDYTSFDNKDLHIIIWKYFSFPPDKFKDKTYLWQMETPFSITVPPPENYKNHFNKIFTYYKPATDGKKVIYVPIPYNYDKIIREYDISKKEILVMHISRYATGHNYKQRTNSVKWFLENHPDDILFYGNDWNKIKPDLSEEAKNLFDKKYGGYIPDKILALSKAKFTLAYENERFDDYVSEKIFDAMAAGSVPIYSGASNITDYVPKECFIDFHQFKNHEELYTYISTMPDKTYNSYLKCIKNYMTEPEKNINHYKNVVLTIISHID